MNTRPTGDRLRETLFNVLAPRISGRAFLDLYAGSGAVGIEAISRGAVPAAFVERSPQAVKILRRNLERLGIGAGIRIHARSVKVFLRPTAAGGPRPVQYDNVFLDPPYEAAEEYAATLGLLGASAAAVLAPGALVVAEHRRKQVLEERYGNLRRVRVLEQGDAALSFFSIES